MSWKKVYRGCAPSKDLVAASWIDFHDLDRNPLGYQRPFDQRRSQLAAQYAEDDPEAFWPECILSIRDNSEVEDESDKVYSKFTEFLGTNGRYGRLTVTYNETRVENIAGTSVPWRRAFSQVDCQHRLGSMANSYKQVTFCIFPNMKRRDEAIVFKTINDKQKKISSSLVDAIILLTDPQAPPFIVWAFQLGQDPGSAFNRAVETGGRNLTPPARLVTLRTLQVCAKTTIPPRVLPLGGQNLGYEFLRNFWFVVKQLWSTEFGDPRNYKLMTLPGLKGLSRFAREIFLDVLDTQDISVNRIQGSFQGGSSLMNWSNQGPLREASGNAGIRIVYEALKNAYPNP